MADLLSELRSSLEKRLHELEPLISEHAQVREALDALKGVGKRAEAKVAGAPRPRTAKRTAASTSTAAKPATTARASERPRGTGARAQEVLKLVHSHPGITIAEIATRMKIKPNYLYRVFSHLEHDGKVTKRDKSYHPPDT